VLNDLKQQGKRFTLFIPTNDALKSYQDIVNGNDMDRKKNVRSIIKIKNFLNIYC